MDPSHGLARASAPLRLSLLPALQRWLAWTSRQRRFDALMRDADEIIFGLIAESRARGQDGEPGEDILSTLLAARPEDGSPMAPQELRDELMPALVAGHETTAPSSPGRSSACRASPRSRRGCAPRCSTARVTST